MARLERRRRLWYAVHDIPPPLRKAIGKSRFFQSLGTDSHREATLRMKVLEGQWIREIEAAKRGKGIEAEDRAEFWKRVLAGTPEEEREVTLSALRDELDAKLYREAEKAGFRDHREEGFEELPVYADLVRTYQIATGALVPFCDRLEDYCATKGTEAKTKDQVRSTAKLFAEECRHVQDVTKAKVRTWTDRLAAEGLKVTSIKRKLSELRGYWTYLEGRGVVKEDQRPFDLKNISEAGEPEDDIEREAFLPSEVMTLLAEAIEREDHQLEDLIRLTMWTGGRLESLCALRTTEVNLEAAYFRILRDKSKAGRRDVPIHSKLMPTMKRLVEASKDGYLLPGFGGDKYADRGGALGKRFGRLKRHLGFGPTKVHHSIRKTVAGLFQTAGVAEPIVAEIVGHDVVTMTYGVYAPTLPLEVKREAMEKIDYPGYRDRATTVTDTTTDA